MLPTPLFRTRLPLASYGRFVTVGLVKLAKLTELLTPLNWVWLSALKASSLTSSLTFCPTEKLFATERSTLLIGGPCRKKRADSVPSLPGCGGAKHDVLICRWGAPPGPLPGAPGGHHPPVWLAAGPVGVA